jgi:hypothetical protein
MANSRKSIVKNFEVSREVIERPAGWRRWDVAYQKLVEWTYCANRTPTPSSVPSQPSTTTATAGGTCQSKPQRQSKSKGGNLCG